MQEPENGGHKLIQRKLLLIRTGLIHLRKVFHEGFISLINAE